MTRQRIFFLIISAIFLAACRRAGEITPALAKTERATPNPATQSLTDTPTSLLPTKIPTSTQLPPTPTLNPQEIAGEVLTGLSIEETHEYSPNGMCEWKRVLAWPFTEAARAKYDNQFFTYATVSCGNQEIPWVLVSQWSPATIGYTIPDVLGWSSDGKYIYVDEMVIPDGCQVPGGFQRNLRRVDLSSGNTHTISIPIDFIQGMTLSPDATMVIYNGLHTQGVGVYDLASGQEQLIPYELPPGMDVWYTGYFTWAPDGHSAVFIIEYGDACFPSGYSLRRVDLPAGKITTLLETKDQALSIIEWKQANRAIVSIGGENYWLDPVSGKTSPIPSQP